MSSSRKVGSSESLQISIPECGICKRTIIKNVVKCKICNKVYHPGCANRIKKCCDEVIASGQSEPNTCEVSPISDTVGRSITNESSHQELLLKIIMELEAKNSLLIENNSLLKYKISSLESIV